MEQDSGSGGEPAPRDDGWLSTPDVPDFETRVMNVLLSWLLGGIFGALVMFVDLQLMILDQIQSAGSDAWGAIARAVSSLTELGFDLLELPFDIATSLAVASGPFAFLVGPMAFALTAAVIAAVLYALWILWQVIPGT